MITASRYHQFVWCLYDWARTVWPVLIVTFVFPNYFVNNVAPTPAQGNILWAYTMTVASIFIAVLAPIIGTLSDTLNNSTPWFRFFTLINIACAFALWFVKPSPDFVTLATSLTIIGVVGFEVAGALYNGYLSLVTTPKNLSKISGVAWGLGYFSGILCLTFCLATLVIPKSPMFGLLTQEQDMHIRAIGPIVGLWYLAFAIPILLLKDSPPHHHQSQHLTSSSTLFHTIKESYSQFITAIKDAKKQPYIYYFLLYRMIYTDGINTLFIFAGIYAAETFGMGFNDIIPFGIACNLSAGIGCFLASASDSVFGEKVTINVSLICLCAFLVILLIVKTLFYFWVFALLATLFLGPLQTSSRSLMAKICPPASRGEFFGLYALTGRVTSFLGPALLGVVSQYTGSQKMGMSTILIFLIVGLIGMLTVKIPNHLILTKKA
ncbi:MAG: MFS transporter [Pseudomonadota bacterium]|nr:MFS transporter [Pseudomonadota bacterium]